MSFFSVLFWKSQIIKLTLFFILSYYRKVRENYLFYTRRVSLNILDMLNNDQKLLENTLRLCALYETRDAI